MCAHVCSGGDLSKILGGAGNPPSMFFLPFPLVDFPGVWAEHDHPLPNNFDAIYAVKQPYKIHTDV